MLLSFRAGCIIQAELLEVIMNVYKNEEVLSNFLVDGSMINQVNTNIQSLRVTNSLAILAGVPIPVLSSAITYLDQLRSKLVGANLIQAQRTSLEHIHLKELMLRGKFIMSGKIKTNFTIFGGTGDLTYRKLIPALYNLYATKKLQVMIELLRMKRISARRIS